MPYRMPKLVKKGFTLIELLVVIAIIALLVSILLPSLNKAKELARRVVCMTNVRSQAYALNMYATENNSRYPCRWGCIWPDYYRGELSPDGMNSYDLMRESYLDAPQIMQCPFYNAKHGIQTEVIAGLYGIWGMEAPCINGPYIWTAAWPKDWAGETAELTLLDGEKPWPVTLDTSDPAATLVTHLRTSGGHDLHHNGAGYGGDAADTSTDTPVGYVDGHVEIHEKSDIRPRVIFEFAQFVY